MPPPMPMHRPTCKCDPFCFCKFWTSFFDRRGLKLESRCALSFVALSVSWLLLLLLFVLFPLLYMMEFCRSPMHSISMSFLSFPLMSHVACHVSLYVFCVCLLSSLLRRSGSTTRTRRAGARGHRTHSQDRSRYRRRKRNLKPKQKRRRHSNRN